MPRRIRSDDDLLFVVATRSSEDLYRRVMNEALRYPSRGEGAVLGLTFERNAVASWGVAICDGTIRSLDSLRVAASGLPRVTYGEEPTVLPAALPVEDQRWSRTIGALGEDTWHRLAALEFAIIGCGRNGSLVSTALGRSGATSLSLIDPDGLEPHSLGEGDFLEADLQSRKAHASRDFVLALPHAATLRVQGIAESVFALPALAAIKKADMLVCCVDNAAARYATALLAKLYLKPLLDIGTGVLNGPGRPMGADIRLVLPDQCLLCVGGIAGLRASRPTSQADWQSHRAGSLRSLNSIATGFGLRMLEDFVAGRLRTHSWLQLDFSASGAPRLRVQEIESNATCPLCTLTGAGDDGLRSEDAWRVVK